MGQVAVALVGIFFAGCGIRLVLLCDRKNNKKYIFELLSRCEWEPYIYITCSLLH